MSEQEIPEPEYEEPSGPPFNSIKLVHVNKYPGAAEVLYHLLSERTPEQSITHKGMPTWEEHLAFCDKPGYRAWNLIMAYDNGKEVPVGSVYLTNRNEIGIFIFRNYARRGAGSLALKRMIRIWTPRLLPRMGCKTPEFYANINPLNEASAQFFANHGFTFRQVMFALPVTQEPRPEKIDADDIMRMEVPND